MVVKRVGVWSAARIYGAICGAFGLFAGLIVALVSMVGAGLASQSDQMPSMLGPLFGVGAVVFLPLLYGIIGIVAGTFSAVLYNIFAAMVGGLEIDVQ